MRRVRGDREASRLTTVSVGGRAEIHAIAIGDDSLEWGQWLGNMRGRLLCQQRNQRRVSRHPKATVPDPRVA